MGSLCAPSDTLAAMGGLLLRAGREGELTYGPITIAIRAGFEYDSTTIRLQHATRCVRFEYDTTSYEELCAFEQ